MNLKAEIEEKKGKYCAVQQISGVNVITMIPSFFNKNEKDVTGYCKTYRCGVPGKISRVEDDFLIVNHFYGYTKSESMIPFNAMSIEDGAS